LKEITINVGIEELEQHLKGMPALIFTKENPFSLFKTLKKSKSSAPAKAGQTAPSDIKVPKGPTSFAPGPVIGELGALRIKAGVEDGKVAIKEDAIVAKEGEVISDKLAGVLTRLGIQPMEVGLNVTAVYEDGNIFTAKVLDIDEEQFAKDLETAAVWAYNLAVNSAYPTKDTINVLLGKAFNDAKALGLSQNIIDEGIIDALLDKAEGSALSLKNTANIEVPDKKAETSKEEKKEEPKETPKKEPKKEEPKAEKQSAEKKPEPKKEEQKKQATKESNKETPSEKKEEKALEDEKKILKEEKQLEKEKSEGAPVEKEIQKAVKEEEEKNLEKERIEKEKEVDKAAEQKKQAEQPSTEDKVAEMVKKTKQHEKGEIPSADDLLKD